MHQLHAFYETKILSDPEFPVEIIHREHSHEGTFFFLHWHEHLEIHYVLQGTGCIQVNQTTYHISPGDLVIINPCEGHCDWCVTQPYASDIVIFDLSALSKELAQMNVLFCPLIRQDETVAGLFERLHKEHLSSRPGSKAACKALVLELMVYLVRNYAAQTLSERDRLQRKKDLSRLNAALAYLDNYYPQPITNAHLAEVACMSESRFIHLFRQSVGVPPMKYLSDIRLRKAMSLLTTSDMSVTDIAVAVGFRDYSNFGRQFFKRFGVTPTSVRRKP